VLSMEWLQFVSNIRVACISRPADGSFRGSDVTGG